MRGRLPAGRLSRIYGVLSQIFFIKNSEIKKAYHRGSRHSHRGVVNPVWHDDFSSASGVIWRSTSADVENKNVSKLTEVPSHQNTLLLDSHIGRTLRHLYTTPFTSHIREL